MCNSKGKEMNVTPLKAALQVRDVNAPMSATKWMESYTYTPNRAPLPATPHEERVRRLEHGINQITASLLMPSDHTLPDQTSPIRVTSPPVQVQHAALWWTVCDVTRAIVNYLPWTSVITCAHTCRQLRLHLPGEVSPGESLAVVWVYRGRAEGIHS